MTPGPVAEESRCAGGQSRRRVAPGGAGENVVVVALTAAGTVRDPSAAGASATVAPGAKP